MSVLPRSGIIVQIFFSKQETAYEMRISDWSSDVCSSDLLLLLDVEIQQGPGRPSGHRAQALRGFAIMAQPIIELQAVNKWYGEFHVLRNINLTVTRGERIVICGPSGSGKSTMIRCIKRLEEHQKGHKIDRASCRERVSQ